MGSVWNHPELGQFTLGRHHWGSKVKIPAFKSFSFPTFGKRSGGNYHFVFVKPVFGPKANTDPPSPEQARIACQILSNQTNLTDRIANAFWEEFHGRGPTSGFWWDDQFDEIQRIAKLERLPSLKNAHDVKSLLKASQVAVGELAEGTDSTVAMITFHAAFEPEHGVSILTNGAEVLGTGYAGEGVLEFYKPRKRSRSRGSR